MSQLQKRARLPSWPVAVGSGIRGGVRGEVGDGTPLAVDADDRVDTSNASNCCTDSCACISTSTSTSASTSPTTENALAGNGDCRLIIDDDNGLCQCQLE